MDLCPEVTASIEGTATVTAKLNTKPGSSSKLARSRLVVEGKRCGYDLDEIRAMVGGSVKALSAAACSEQITKFSGRGLPNPPGQKPRPCDRKGKSSGATRMITADQVDQIRRLSSEYFDDESRLEIADWLSDNFKIPAHPNHRLLCNSEFGDHIRQLGTAKRGGEVIRVLKTMLARRQKKEAAR